MYNKFKLLIATIAILAQVTTANAADTAIASLHMSGNVPTIFSLTIRGLPGDLDLTPGVLVNDRLLGIVHFKYNIDIASLLLTSDAADGIPMNGADAYPAGTPFTYKFGACASVAAVGEAAMTIALGTGPEMVEAAAGQPSTLGYGIEEDCDLTASWGGQAIVAGQIPLAGKYSQTLTVTMISI